MTPESKTKSSLTGSEGGAPETHTVPVAAALRQLRSSVALCCWILAAALSVQIVIWGLITFTDIRWTVLKPGEGEAPVVVSASDVRAHSIRSALDDEPEEATVEAIDPNRMLTGTDRILAVAASFGSGAGLLAALAILPLVGIGVLLAAASATVGVEKAVSAFGWSLVVVLLALPLGGVVGLPWQGGAMYRYAELTGPIDYAVANEEKLGLVFYARFVALPVMCGIGTLLIANRFSAGVAAGVLRNENLTLDQNLEKEAGNIKTGTLHAGRTAGAMKQAFGTDKTSDEHEPAHARQPTAGEVPKRLI
jgi:hypothetical protein